MVERQAEGTEVRYVLTQAGKELQPVVEALGAWGVRWIGELGDEDLDPQLLLWDMHRHVDSSAVPDGRTVVRFWFPDAASTARDWWLVINRDAVDVCDADPGHDVAVTVIASLRSMVRIWRGDMSWSEGLRSGAVEVKGPERLRRSLPGWFTLSVFAGIPRPT